MTDRTGQQLGIYRLVSLIGTGGSAEVYVGQHVRLDLQAAIKVLHTHLTGVEAERFQQEAQIIARLAHPSIVRVFDFDVQDEVAFLVMDYAPNGSLRVRHPKGSVVPYPLVVSYIRQVAGALQYAHEQRFIHRDVKPENMLLGRREEVLLSDFGIATLAHSTASHSLQEMAGTIAYMAPEQIEGHPRPASDQYALGVVAYEWLCGQRPFEGSLTEVTVQHLMVPPAPLREKVATIPLEIEQVVLQALAKDPRQRFPTVQSFAVALEQASGRAPTLAESLPSELASPDAPAASTYSTVAMVPGQPTPPGETPPAQLTVLQASSQPPAEPVTPPRQAGEATIPALREPAIPTPPLPPTSVGQRWRPAPLTAGLLIGLVVLILAGGILAGTSLFARLHNSTTPPGPVRGGTWTDDMLGDLDSLIPHGSTEIISQYVDHALYLPLFYGDAQGVIHPGAAREIPTLHNGGVNANATTWTFRLRSGLLWSDGQPYDARDVDYSWRLWLNPPFSLSLFLPISSAVVSPDNLSITFHLKHSYVPFLQYWADGSQAPLPAHHFSAMAPDQILKSPDNLNPTVTSGPFMMSESLPGDHYTVVRNPRYYLANQGLPYLDRVVFRVVSPDTLLKDMQSGSIDSVWLHNAPYQAYQHLSGYSVVTSPTSARFEFIRFNFHNTVLATHLEVRRAIAYAIDQQALIQKVRPGFATPLCTDHPSAQHPGYDPNAPCPQFNRAAANKLLDDNGWVKGPDGVRTRGGQRLEFEYSAPIGAGQDWRTGAEMFVQESLKEIGIKLDIQNYAQLFSFLATAKASPPTGAVAGRFDISQSGDYLGYDPDDSYLLACDQRPPAPAGANFGSYCNRTLDALYQQELATPDPGQRQQIFIQIHTIYLTDYPFVVLFSLLEAWVVHKGTNNYLPSPINGETGNIWEWWCNSGKC